MKTLKIGSILESKGIITKNQLDTALAIQREKRHNGDIQLLGSIMVDLDYITEDMLHILIKEHYPSPTPGREYSFIAARMREILGDAIFENAERSVSSERGHDHVFSMLARLGIASFDSQKKFIYDLMKPFSIGSIELGDIKKIDGTGDDFIYDDEQVEVVFIPHIGLADRQIIFSRIEWEEITQSDKDRVDENNMVGAEEELPYSIETIFEDACNAGATDVHIVYKEKGYYIAFRINGDYVIQKKYTEYVLSLKKGNDLVYYIKHRCGARSSVNASERRKVQDGKFSLPDVHGGIDLRVVIIPDGEHEHEEIIVRIFHRKNLKAIPLTELGYYEDDVAIMMKAFRRKRGLMIICGVTGAGKTRLGNQLLLGDTKRKIETFEDPIEYFLPNPNICQHQISIPKQEDIKLGYLELVKASKRGDPDVLYVAEIRKDMELFEALGEGSYAGQLVIGTIHVSSAFLVPKAITDIFKTDRYTVSTLILYTINQDLVKQLCSCKIEDEEGKNAKTLENIRNELPFVVTDKLDAFLKNPPKTYVVNPRGCQKCNHTGYQDQRTPIYEYYYPDAKFIEWMMNSDSQISHFEIEKKACSGDAPLGVNKLYTFIRKLEDGIIDVSDETLKSLI